MVYFHTFAQSESDVLIFQVERLISFLAMSSKLKQSLYQTESDKS